MRLPDHGTCKRTILDFLAEKGVGGFVTVRPDHGCSWFQEHICPHGISLWAHPTDAQLQEWKDRGMLRGQHE